MRAPPALADPGYRLFISGNFFALQGMWAQRTIIGWLAWELTGSAASVGIIAFLSFSPTLISGPIFGVLADRSDLRRAAIKVQVAMALVSFLLFAALAAGVLTLTLLSALALAQGVTVSAHHPIRMALTPRIAPKGALANAIAISSLNFNLARLSGPVIGGYAIAHFGAAPAQAAVTVLMLPVAWVLLRIRPRARSGAAAAPAGFFASLREGAQYAATHPSIRSAMALTIVFATIVRGLMELLPVIADGVFARGASGLGELMAAAGAGALAAALWLASGDAVRENDGAPPSPPLRTLLALYFGFAAVGALSIAPGWPLALAATVLIGFCSTLVGVTMQSVVQLAVDDAHRGRVMSLWIMVGIGSASIGALAMGAMAELIGVALTLQLAAGSGAAFIAALMAADYSRRRISRSSASRKRDLSALEKGRPPPP